MDGAAGDPGGGPLQRVFHWADYTVFCVMLAVSMGVGVYFSVRLRGRDVTSLELLLGGRRLSVFPVAVSILATYLSTVIVLTVPGETFFGGVRLYVGLAFIPATVFTAHVFLPLFHQMELVSTYQYLGHRFNTQVRSLGSITFVIMMLLVETLALFSPAEAFSKVAGVSLEMSVLGAGLVATFYTAMGGVRAVVWNDMIQVVSILGAFIAILSIGVYQVGGLGTVIQLATDNGRLKINNFQFAFDDSNNFWAEFLGGGVLWLSMLAANQAIVQRFCSVDKCRKAQGSLYLSMVFYIVSWVIALLSGLVIFGFYASCNAIYTEYLEHPSQLLPLFIMDTVGHLHGVPGLLTGAIFGSILSSVASTINSLAAVTLEDVVKPVRMRMTGREISPLSENLIVRGLALSYGLLTIGLSYVPSLFPRRIHILGTIFSVFGVFGGPLLGAFLLGALFPIATSMGAVIGLVTGVAVLLWAWVGHLVCPTMEEQLWDIGGTQPLCSLGNATEQTPIDLVFSRCPLQEFYDLSYLWYALLGILVTSIVGLFVSFFTCDPKSGQIVDPALLCCGKTEFRKRTHLVVPRRVDLSRLQRPAKIRTPPTAHTLIAGSVFDNPLTPADGFGPATPHTGGQSVLSSGPLRPHPQAATSGQPAVAQLSHGGGALTGYQSNPLTGFQSSHLTSPQPNPLTIAQPIHLGVGSALTPGGGASIMASGAGPGSQGAALGGDSGVLSSPRAVGSSLTNPLLQGGPGFHYPQAFPARDSESINPLSPG